MRKTFTKLAIAGAAAALALPAQAASVYYQQGFSNNLYVYDTVTMTETLVGSLGLSSDSLGMAFTSGGTLFAFERASQSLYTVNTNTGAATLVGNSGIAAEDFTVNLDGTTGYASANGSFYSIDLATGISALVGSISPTLDGLTTATTDVTIAGTSYSAGSVFGIDSGRLYAVDENTGATTFLGGTTGDEALTFGSDGTLYTHRSGQLFTIDLNTLSGTAIAGTAPRNVFGMAVAPFGAVPEPGTWLMMILGFGLIGASMRTSKTTSRLKAA